ncbi:MAG TPA: response regulator, partial [Candidatus Dormibacteraeota bacterium]|nr:response regulator [Candidatus Dormibacteraeota bacterium]
MSIEPGAQLRHELRTPLNHIIGYAELLLEELEAGDQPELAADLAALRADARQLLTLLNEVLARGQTGPPDLAAARGTLGPPLDRVRAAGESLHRRAAAAGAGARLADLDRIRAATVRLDDLLGGTARSAPDAAPAAPGGGAGDPTGPPRAVILVVDDNEDNRDMLARRLRRQSYDVQTAAGGRAALAALAESPVDLVLLDVMMPDLDGYAVLERLKA